MGIVTDEGVNMFGPEKSIEPRLLKDYHHVLGIVDFSHHYNLIFEKGLKTFPSFIQI